MRKFLHSLFIIAVILALFLFGFIPGMNMVSERMNKICSYTGIEGKATVNETAENEQVPKFFRLACTEQGNYTISLMGMSIYIDGGKMTEVFVGIQDRLYDTVRHIKDTLRPLY